MNDICVSCHYARMRRDICGIYCVGKFFKKQDGTCQHYLHHREVKSGKRKNDVAQLEQAVAV